MIWKCKYRGCLEGSKQLLETRFFVGAPGPRSIFGGECIEWTSNAGKVLYETAVEVREAKEGLVIFDSLGHRPTHNGCNLFRVHVESIMGDE